jgi:methylated-DNA-[protein]-cysteine S-methyltransferase
MTCYVLQFQSCLGHIRLTGTEAGLERIAFQASGPDGPGSMCPSYMQQAKAQILEYLQGRRTTFDIPFTLRGTIFQRTVWNALLEIPYGRIVSYADIARKVGNPRACRAVGGANNKNPLPIVIPCHRVVGHNGRLVGYGSGLWRKRLLLEVEGIAVTHTHH